MTKIKLCGIMRICDIDALNETLPEYAGFVFAKKSHRYITPDTARLLRQRLDPSVSAVGVFVDEKPEIIAGLLDSGIIDLAQLHGSETDEYIEALRKLTNKPLIQAFRVRSEEDVIRADKSTADLVLTDAGAGCGEVFDWTLLDGMKRPFFLAGGLSPENVAMAIEKVQPYAVDVSSGIETDGKKDRKKIAAFAAAVRKEVMS